MDIIRRDINSEFPVTTRRDIDPFRMMRDMMRWDPFRDLGAWENRTRGYTPSFDVRETRDSYVFEADIPGLREEDIEVSLTGNRLNVSGNRTYEARDEGDNYYTCERNYGQFSRAFTLPEGCNMDNVKANLENGVLTIHVAKRPEVQAKKISLTRGHLGTGGGVQVKQKVQ